MKLDLRKGQNRAPLISAKEAAEMFGLDIRTFCGVMKSKNAPAPVFVSKNRKWYGQNSWYEKRPLIQFLAWYVAKDKSDD